MIDMSQWNSVGDADTPFIFFLEYDVWGFLVDADTEPFEFVLDDPLFCQGFIDVQDNEY